MSDQLRITVRLLDGRYHGDDWPPSPARLFQALVAGASTGCRVLQWPRSCAALKWLEQLEPPRIVVPFAEETKKGVAYKAYGPNNDSDSPKVVELVRAGQLLPEAMRKAAMITTKHYRPRLIDKASDCAIHYQWSLPSEITLEDRTHAEQVCRLARNIFALGWGIDMTTGEGNIFSGDAPLPPGRQYIPGGSGVGAISIDAPGPGFLEDLSRAYNAFRQRAVSEAVDTDTRPRAHVSVKYRVVGRILGRSYVAFVLLDAQGEERSSIRWEDGMKIAAWMRHTAKERFLLEGWDCTRVDSYVCGHTPKGQENNRLSFVPLPSIGHTHSDGHYRRALVALPFAGGEETEELAILRRMAGDPLVALDREGPVGWLGAGETSLIRDSVLARYLGEATEWSSVTPVILHGRVTDDGKFRPRKADKLILQAFMKSGYPAGAIADFSYQPAPYWRGPGAAMRARVPRHLSRWPHYHVRVTFSQKVKGPVLVGIGRHCGLGTFAISG